METIEIKLPLGAKNPRLKQMENYTMLYYDISDYSQRESLNIIDYEIESLVTKDDCELLTLIRKI